MLFYKISSFIGPFWLLLQFFYIFKKFTWAHFPFQYQNPILNSTWNSNCLNQKLSFEFHKHIFEFDIYGSNSIFWKNCSLSLNHRYETHLLFKKLNQKFSIGFEFQTQIVWTKNWTKNCPLMNNFHDSNRTKNCPFSSSNWIIYWGPLVCWYFLKILECKVLYLLHFLTSDEILRYY